MRPVLFIDVDGVLNRMGNPEQGRTVDKWQGFMGMEPELVARMNRLVKKTDAFVVLSSTWRRDPNWREVMQKNGLNFEFLDRTPVHHRKPRGYEILTWLKANRDLKRYAIIDDETDMLALQKPHFFHTDYRFGLTEKIADAVYTHLMSTQKEYVRVSYPY